MPGGICFGLITSSQLGCGPFTLILHYVSSRARCCPSTSFSVFLPKHIHHHHSFTRTFLFCSHYLSVFIYQTFLFLDISVLLLMISFLIMSTCVVRIFIQLSNLRRRTQHILLRISALYIIASLATELI